ncbi:tetratricopeptide repeat protein [Aestuariirhabdus sp. Z084]|uniref:tetratricopeptide repeat protein n=1 Tax=Aestuariirhabdus haliotis TaxID=2918751 RepID=UPI00201B3769|nr:tetratricopeptide repeat protein [Aestuariirhabdus haliotis]MCL6416880.1 tetratricopeptide repeat protein [Aestuariirhabdus haliotis]MCL6420901.1 tetratricopeptide repeat protein [Aestuariirhabdus haliotis]
MKNIQGIVGFCVVVLFLVGSPVFAKDYLDSAKGYLEKNDNASAIIELKNYLDGNPESVEGRELLAEAEIKAGDFSEAIKQYEYLDKQGLLSNKLSVDLANLYIVNRMPEKALVLLSSSNPSPEYRARFELVRGNAFFAQAMLVDAREAFNESLRLESSSGATLGLAKILVAEKRLDEANAMVSGLLMENPDNAEALLLSAKISSFQGRYDEAVDTLSDLESKGFGGLIVLIRKSEALMGGGKNDEAEKVLKEVLQRDRGNVQANFNLGRLYLSKKEYKKSREYFEKTLSRVPNHLPSMYLISIAHYQLGAKNQARDLLNRYLSHYPENKTARIMLGTILLDQGEYSDVISLFESDFSADFVLTGDSQPPNPVELLLIGKAYMGLGDNEKGIQYLEMSRDASGENSDIEGYLAEAYLKEGNLKAASLALSKLEVEDRGVLNSDSQLIRFYLQEGEYDAADAYISERINTNPDVKEYQHLVGSILEARQQYSKARDQYLSVIKMDSKYSPSIIGVARCYVKMEEIPKALSFLREHLDQNELDINVSIYYANLLYTEGNSDQALNVLLKAQEKEGIDSRVSLILSTLYLQSEDYDKAAIHAGRALSENDDSLPANRLMLQISMRREEGHNVDHYFTRLLSIDPNMLLLQEYLGWMVSKGEYKRAREYLNDFSSRNDLKGDLNMQIYSAELFEVSGDKKTAKSAFSKLSKQYPDKIEVVMAMAGYISRNQSGIESSDFLANAYDRTGDSRYVSQMVVVSQGKDLSDRTVEIHKKVLSEDPDNVVIINNLAWILMKRNDQDSLKYGKKAYELVPDNPQVLDTYGWALVNFNKEEEGVIYLEKAFKASQGSGEISYHYAVACFKTGRLDEARAVLEPLLSSKLKFADRENAEGLLNKIVAGDS